MKTEDISGFHNLTIEPATIDEIVVFTSKKGDDYEQYFEIHKIRYCIGKTIF